MELILIIVGIIFSGSLIKKNKWIAVSLGSFFILELIFRDFGIFGFPAISSFFSKITFLVSTIILCLSSIKFIYNRGDENL